MHGPGVAPAGAHSQKYQVGMPHPRLMRLPSSNTCAAPVIHPSNSYRSCVGSKCVYTKHRPGPGYAAKERQRSEPSYVRCPSITPVYSVLTLHLHSQPSNTYDITSRSSYQVLLIDCDRWEQRESKNTEKKPAESSRQHAASQAAPLRQSPLPHPPTLSHYYPVCRTAAWLQLSM
jgi:hypothetical protein